MKHANNAGMKSNTDGGIILQTVEKRTFFILFLSVIVREFNTNWIILCL